MAGMFDLLGGGAAENPETPKQPGMFSNLLSGATDAGAGVMQKVQSDPNLQRALMVAGLNLMRPGVSLGQAGIAGVGAYELGKQAEIARQQREAESARKMDEAQRNAEMHRENVLSKQFDRTNSERVTGLEERKVVNSEKESESRRDLTAAQAGEVKERTKFIGEKARADIEQSRASAASSYASAENSTEQAANTRQKTASEKLSDFQAKVEAFSNLPEFAGETDPVRRKALATQKVIQTEKGYATGMKLEQADASAIAVAEYFDTLDEQSQRIALMSDPNLMKQVAYGRRIRAQASGAQTGAAPAAQQAVPPTAPAPAQAPRRVIRLEDINETRSARQSSGTIGVK